MRKPNQPPVSVSDGSYTDTHGATVTIPTGEAANYAGVRSEQLRDVVRLLSCATVGGLAIDKPIVETLHLLANELADDVNAIIDLIAALDLQSEKGGAQ